MSDSRLIRPLAQLTSRRKLLTTAAAGSALLLATPLLAACGGDDAATNTPSTSGAGPSPTTAAQSTAAPAAPTAAATEAPADATGTSEGQAADATTEAGYTYAPQTGIEREQLIVGVQSLPSSVDPARELSNVGTRISFTPYDTLIRRDFLNNNEHVPSLATTWERVSDTELQLTLRDDVTFHDGSPMTADDVVFTFMRLLEAPADSEVVEAKTYFSSFEKVEKIDDHTVKITTLAPDPLLVKRVASWASWIISKNYYEEVGYEKFKQTGMGTGPYKIASFVPDDKLEMERYDGYWGDPSPAKKIVFRVIPEVAARVTALINNEVQIVTNIPPDQVRSFEGQAGVEVREVALANVHVLNYNTKNPKLASKQFRQALNLGIDRELIIETIWSGKAVPKRGHQFAEYGPLYNPDRPLTPYDPDRAKELLKEAGYNGEEIQYQLAAGYYTNGEQVGEAIVSMWQDIGINAVVRILEQSATGADREVATWSNSSRLADPDGSIWLLWGTNSSVQKNYWDAPAEFNELGEAARSTLDEDERYDLYQKLLDVWEDEAPGTVLYDPHEFYGVNSSVNWSPYSFYYMDLRAYNLSFETP